MKILSQGQPLPPATRVEDPRWSQSYAKGVAEAAAPVHQVKLWQEGGRYFVRGSTPTSRLTADGSTWYEAVVAYIGEITVRRLEAQGKLPEGFVSLQGPPAG